MYHIFAAERQRQYGPFDWQNQTLAAASFLLAPDPPGLVELAPALFAGVGGVEQQRDRAAPGGRLDLLGAEDQIAGARLEPEPVERGLPQRRLDPRAEIPGHGDLAALERAIEGAPELALGVGCVERD